MGLNPISWSWGMRTSPIQLMPGLSENMKAPIGVLGAMKAANKYTGSAIGQNLHFADPELKGALGLIQELTRRGIRGSGEPLMDLYVNEQLGHRP